MCNAVPVSPMYSHLLLFNAVSPTSTDMCNAVPVSPIYTHLLLFNAVSKKLILSVKSEDLLKT